MQEELVRVASSKVADREASAERARRIKEDNQRDETVERQETVELLLNVQKQLLDTCGHLQVSDGGFDEGVLSITERIYSMKKTITKVEKKLVKKYSLI